MIPKRKKTAKRATGRAAAAGREPKARRSKSKRKAPKKAYIPTDRYIVIGRLYGSDDVAKEAGEARARWKRDVGALGEYGHGKTAFDKFEVLLDKHSDLRVARPKTVAAKSEAVRERDRHVSAGWTWVDKVVSVLTREARDDEDLAGSLRTAAPTDDSELEAGIGALAGILRKVKPKLPKEDRAEERLGEARGLRLQVKEAIGTAATAKTAPIADTAAIDLLDGKLYVAIRDLNKAARRAIGNGELGASSDEYRFHHLRPGRRARTSGSTQQDAPAVTNTP